MPDKRQAKNRKGWDIVWNGSWIGWNVRTREQLRLNQPAWANAVRELEEKKNITWY